MKKKNLFILIIFVFLTYSSYLYLPHVVSKYHSIKSFKKYDLKVKKINVEDNLFEYVEGGSGEILIFIHGFQSNKNFWIPYFKKFNKNYKIIALDLPGHGNSSRPKNQRYDLQSMAETLHKFIYKKNIDKCYIIGTSMGGGISAVYAHKHPEKVKKLILINPLGIDQEKKSDLQLLLEQGRNILFPTNLNEFDQMTTYITGKKLYLNFYFKKFFLNQMIKNYSFFQKVFEELLTKTVPLDNILAEIKTPSLILVGQKDRIIHPASYEFFIKLMPNLRVVRFKEGMHAFTGKYLEEALDKMDNFLKSE